MPETDPEDIGGLLAEMLHFLSVNDEPAFRAYVRALCQNISEQRAAPEWLRYQAIGLANTLAAD